MFGGFRGGRGGCGDGPESRLAFASPGLHRQPRQTASQELLDEVQDEAESPVGDGTGGRGPVLAEADALIVPVPPGATVSGGDRLGEGRAGRSGSAHRPAHRRRSRTTVHGEDTSSRATGTGDRA